MCDTAAMIYLPLLEETGHMPTEKYTLAPEILEHCQRIAKHFDLYDNALFSTEVTALEWDDDIVALDHPHQPRRRDAGQVRRHGHRPLHRPKLPGHPGHRDASPATASTPAGGTTTTPAATRTARRMDKLADKRVGIIGTGATAVQCIPHLARDAPGAVRVPAHAVVDRRPQQPPDRPGLVRRRSSRAGRTSG